MRKFVYSHQGSQAVKREKNKSGQKIDTLIYLELPPITYPRNFLANPVLILCTLEL